MALAQGAQEGVTLVTWLEILAAKDGYPCARSAGRGSTTGVVVSGTFLRTKLRAQNYRIAPSHR